MLCIVILFALGCLIELLLLLLFQFGEMDQLRGLNLFLCIFNARLDYIASDEAPGVYSIGTKPRGFQYILPALQHTTQAC